MFKRQQHRFAEARSRAGKIREAGLGLSAAVAALAVLALLTPLAASFDTGPRVGVLLATASLIEFLHSFRRSTARGRRSSWQSAGFTAGMAVLLISAPLLAAAALVLFVAATFALDGVRAAAACSGWTPARSRLAAHRHGRGRQRRRRGRAARHPRARRRLDAGRRRRPSHVRRGVDHRDDARATRTDAGDTVVATSACRITRRSRARQAARARGERPRVDRPRVGGRVPRHAVRDPRRPDGLRPERARLLSPAVAVVGDAVFALMLAFGVVMPSRVVGTSVAAARAAGVAVVPRPPTRARRVWRWSGRAARVAGAPAALLGPPAPGALLAADRARPRPADRPAARRHPRRHRARLGHELVLRHRELGRGDLELVGRGAHRHLARGDGQRRDAASMAAGRPAPPSPSHPPGVAGGGDFSFIVIGDTGEGDASQHVLRDQLLRSAAQRRRAVRRDLVGRRVPDRRDAGLRARSSGCRSRASRSRCTRSRATTTGTTRSRRSPRRSSTPTRRAPRCKRARRGRQPADAARPTARIDRTDRGGRRGCGASTACRRGFQQAPFFQIQTDRFALIAVDTGVARPVDPAQMAWLRAGARRGARQADDGGPRPPVLRGRARHRGGQRGLRRSCTHCCATHRGAARDGRRHARPRVLRRAARRGRRHGAPLRQRRRRRVPELRHRARLAAPARDARLGVLPDDAPTVTGKIDATTPWWKRPAWWWTRSLGAWPFSAEWLSAAFDYNAAPFFQSFVEVARRAVGESRPPDAAGIHGRLRWSDCSVRHRCPPARHPTSSSGSSGSPEPSVLSFEF